MAMRDDAQKYAKQAFVSFKKVSQKGGSFLGSATNAKATQKKHQDAHSQTQRKTSSTNNQFQEQLPKLGKRILGKRYSKVFGLINRFVPDAIVQGASERAYMQLASLAHGWSKLDRPKAFADIQQFTPEDKQKLADAIANENRVLAAVGGGLTGLTGLLGMIGDLLWLLLICLKTIYQTAEAYDKPLSGTQGAKRAFEILSMADLSKLGEKQAVMLGLGAASEVIDDVDLHTLQDVVSLNPNIKLFQNGVKQVTDQLGIDLNFGFLNRFLPIAASVTSAAYSVYVINEISATAIAEFESVAGFLEDKSK